MIFLKIR